MIIIIILLLRNSAVSVNMILFSLELTIAISCIHNNINCY